tara:strand:- start:5452 stop:5595 length:144 start_codon:yes stop_codon:yes gene_type:complete
MILLILKSLLFCMVVLPVAAYIFGAFATAGSRAAMRRNNKTKNRSHG